MYAVTVTIFNAVVFVTIFNFSRVRNFPIFVTTIFLGFTTGVEDCNGGVVRGLVGVLGGANICLLSGVFTLFVTIVVYNGVDYVCVTKTRSFTVFGFTFGYRLVCGFIWR